MSRRPSAQPKKGTHSSSRLKTKLSGRGISDGNASVSQADWCLGSRMAGPWGRRSQPCTRQRMPQIQRAPQTASRVQPTHSQYRRSPRMKMETSSTTTAYGTTVTMSHSR